MGGADAGFLNTQRPSRYIVWNPVMERDAIQATSTAGAHLDGPAPRPSALVRAGRATRRAIGRSRTIERAYRIAVGTVGGVLAVGGLLLVPLPGPGWLIVFAGLAVLGTEFGWARRAAGWLRRQLERFWAWWKARRERKAAAAR